MDSDAPIATEVKPSEDNPPVHSPPDQGDAEEAVFGRPIGLGGAGSEVSGASPIPPLSPLGDAEEASFGGPVGLPGENDGEEDSPSEARVSEHPNGPPDAPDRQSEEGARASGEAPAAESQEAGKEAANGAVEGEGAPEELVSTHTLSRKHHVAPALIPLDRVDEDHTFRIRSDGDIDLLATDIARVGQLFPVDVRLRPPDRFQIISGFRRVKALRFLHREKVLARLHTDLSDEDALLLALTAAIHAQPVFAEELRQVKARLSSEGRLTALLSDMLDKALNPNEELSPETVEEEIDADELAQNAAAKLAEINQDLSLIADVFASLDEERKLELLKQLRYSAELVAYLEGL